jgi:hypothetical protein
MVRRYVGVYVRGSLVGFCGLTAKGKAWITEHFSCDQMYQILRPVDSTFGIRFDRWPWLFART